MPESKVICQSNDSFVFPLSRFVFYAGHPRLYGYQLNTVDTLQNVILATEWSQNGLSATVVRRALARGQSVRYLVPDAALEEIYSRGLYGAARPSRPSLLLLVPPSTSALQTTPLPSMQTAEQVEPPKNVPTQSSLKSAEEIEVEYREPQHPSTW
ncbi:hypothetical protein ACTXT7_014123 [Hymenolepis weldensis]